MRALILCAIPLLSGCLSLERPPAEQRRFVLAAERPAREPVAGKGHLAVVAFQISPLWAGPGFVHRLASGEAEADFHAGFFVPPAVLVADATRRWLAQSGMFATVSADGSRALPTHVLEGDVTDLYVDEREAGAPAAVLGIEFVLLDAERRALLRHVRLSHRAPLADLRPETIAQGWNACLAAVLAALEADLKENGR